ncbi:uncharacterized protein LOC132316365 [Cornus florida]|uniref:uncharacterized protein LOC132316365 n=1 Tax=Cornus florida TaxID=4283 RepID=UPI00289EDC4D|nr:uncharacterized protein LOC132316365 [Cornus florida]
MATPYLAENPIKSNKFKDYPQKANGISRSFLLSIFIYISIFYFFNLSPSTLFNTTKFWFFISNTLILIIAADSGAFSSSKNQGLYEEYVKHSHSRVSSSSSFESQYPEIVEKSNIIPQKELIAIENSQEKKEIIAVHERESPEKNGELLENSNSEMAPKIDNEAREKKKNETRFVRSVSDKAIPVKENDNHIVLRRSETEKREPNEKSEDEFSEMSDEELNKRVEEFIQRFNRQIRLQAAERKFHQI